MKAGKLIIKLTALIFAAGSIAAFIAACTSTAAPVCYYGCPNSKRIEKLNLRKKKAGR